MVVATAAEVAAIAGAQASRRHADSTNGEGDPTVQGMLADKVLLGQRIAACATFSDRDQPSENAGELVATRRAAKRAAKALDAAANSKRKKTEGATQPTQAPLPTVTTTDAITTTTASVANGSARPQRNRGLSLQQRREANDCPLGAGAKWKPTN